MKKTERKASAGMIRFVITIFTLGVLIAAGYLLFLTPGEVPVAG